MLRFMYSFDYSHEPPTPGMVFDAKVYQIADKYDIQALRKHARRKFKDAVSPGWSVDDFSKAVKTTWKRTFTTDRGLRDLILKASCLHINELLKNKRFRGLLSKNSDFAVDLIHSLSRRFSRRSLREKCGCCEELIPAVVSSRHDCCPRCGKRRLDLIDDRDI